MGEPSRLAAAPRTLLWVRGRFGLGGDSDIRVVDAGVLPLTDNDSPAPREEGGPPGAHDQVIEDVEPSQDGLTCTLGEQQIQHNDSGSEVTDDE